jgi:hypothetical protein
VQGRLRDRVVGAVYIQATLVIAHTFGVGIPVLQVWGV